MNDRHPMLSVEEQEHQAIPTPDLADWMAHTHLPMDPQIQRVYVVSI